MLKRKRHDDDDDEHNIKKIKYDKKRKRDDNEEDDEYDNRKRIKYTNEENDELKMMINELMLRNERLCILIENLNNEICLLKNKHSFNDYCVYPFA
jgi:hypothetical protein